MFALGISRLWSPVALVFVIAAACLLESCARDAEHPGQLMVVLDTDMALPDQIDSVHVLLTISGATVYERDFELGSPNVAAIPGTIAFASHEKRAAPVTVSVAGSKRTDKGLEWRTFREAVTAIPADRVAMLRMPLQWLCNGSAEMVPGDTILNVRARSTCGAGNTCRAGGCESSAVSAASLPNYEPSEVFGGGETPKEGSCFDTLGCMQDAAIALPDDACSIAKPATERINVALQVAQGGICDDTGEHCFVPLDGHDREGWTVSGDRIALPAAVCDKLSEGSVRAVQISSACQTKTPDVPACGPWSSVKRGKAGVFRPASDVMSSPGSR